MGNNLRGARGERVFGTTDNLYGAPISLSTARMVLIVAAMRDWAVEVGDVDGAYLMADLGGPPVYMRLPKHLWGMSGVGPHELERFQDPCVRVRKAMCGLPRAGFDWFAYCDTKLVSLGWKRHRGVDSVYYKQDAIMAVYVGDILMAGSPHARRREWAALSRDVKLRGKPERLDRLLGARYDVRPTGKYSRVIRVTQHEYVASVIGRYNAAAPFPAGKRATPVTHRRERSDVAGDRATDCRSFVGSLMYVVRASRPDATFALGRMARNASTWTKDDDTDLTHLVGYLSATTDSGLEMDIDVRDRTGSLWLELWVDADHAGHPDRRSTGGWILFLKGEHGTSAAIDWASRKQAMVSRSSGEAETTALNDAFKDIAAAEFAGKNVASVTVGVSRGLCAGGLPVMDFMETALNRKIPLIVYVDASVCKAAAEKGTSQQMRYLSKTQGVDLFWLRDVKRAVPVDMGKTTSAENVADAFTKALSGHRTTELREKMGVRRRGDANSQEREW